MSTSCYVQNVSGPESVNVPLIEVGVSLGVGVLARDYHSLVEFGSCEES